MFDLLSRAVYDCGEKINESVVYVKQNKSICSEICQEIHYLSSLLKEIENKIQILSPATHDTLVRYLPLMKKGYDEALEYIDSHIHVGHIKKFYTSKSTKYHLENVIRNLSRIKQTLTTALVDDLVDPIVCSTPIPSTVGIEKHVESMLLAFSTSHFLQSLQIAKEVSKKIPLDDTLAKAGIHYDMACIYSMLFNPRSVVFHLQSAKACGFSDFKELDEDHDFDNVRYHLEFMNFRQNMEYEVLQTDKWRELSEKAVNKLTSLFNCYDQSGNGVLGFTQFHALCADSFPATTPAQVISFFQETCEDTIESMKLSEFLNFMVEHAALLNKVVPNVSNQHYNSFTPIFTSSHFFPLNSATKSFEMQPNYFTHHYYQNNITFQPIISSISSISPLSPLSSIPFFSNAVDFSSQHEGNIRGQDCGWLENVNQPKVACQQKVTAQSVYVTDHFSYYTTTDPLASFRC